MRGLITVFELSSLTPVHVGKAISENPGYLKLRKIRAAQNIARTVWVICHFIACFSVI